MSVPATVSQRPKLPAIFQKVTAQDAFSEFTAGVTSGFPVISFRGKVWRIRKAGKEENYLDENGDAMPSIQVVLIKSNPHVSKIFYKAKFEEGSVEAPDCWSSNGIAPDKEVTEPVSKACVSCPNNIWGSRITESGTKARACSDVRRVAVVFKQELEEQGKHAPTYLLRIPPASLNPLKEYAEQLHGRGIYPFALVTKIGFDPQVSHPKIALRPVRILNDEEAEAVMALRDDPTVKRILAESAEFAVAGTTDGKEDGAEGSAAAPFNAPAPAAASPPKRKAKTLAVEEEDFPEETAAVATPPPAVDEDDFDKALGTTTPPPPPVSKKPKAPKPAKTSAPVGVPTAAPAPADDFDSMLEKILGN